MSHSQRHYSIEEYWVVEEMSPIRYEYFDGEIIAMGGVSNSHDAICVNVLGLVYKALEDLPCRAYTGRMRVRTPSGLYTYPDASVVCEPADIFRVGNTDTIGNPVVLFEVLSEATCDYDRGLKFDLYQSILTLRDYVLIEQSKTEIEHRFLSGSEWTSRTTAGLDGSVRLTGVDVELPLALVYERVEL